MIAALGSDTPERKNEIMGIEFKPDGFFAESKNIETQEMPETFQSGPAPLVTLAHKKAFKKKEGASFIINEIGLPAPGQSIDFISRGEANAGAFYECVKEKWGGNVEEACIATWIINRYYIDMLLSDVRAGRLNRLVFVISNRMRQLGHHAGNFNFLIAAFGEEPNIMARVANSHAKTFGMTNGKDFICVDGSANWTDNPRLENYTMTNSKEKYDFKIKWMKEIVAK